jgi:hypothetical protein
LIVGVCIGVDVGVVGVTVGGSRVAVAVGDTATTALVAAPIGVGVVAGGSVSVGGGAGVAVGADTHATVKEIITNASASETTLVMHPPE